MQQIYMYITYLYIRPFFFQGKAAASVRSFHSLPQRPSS